MLARTQRLFHVSRRGLASAQSLVEYPTADQTRVLAQDRLITLKQERRERIIKDIEQAASQGELGCSFPCRKFYSDEVASDLEDKGYSVSMTKIPEEPTMVSINLFWG